MLPKPHRIRKQREFDLIYRQNQTINSKIGKILLRYINSSEKENFPHREYPRFAFVASKKIGNAVTRNKIKRIFREITRNELKNLKRNFEAIIIADTNIRKMNFHKIKQELSQTFKKFSLYK